MGLDVWRRKAIGLGLADLAAVPAGEAATFSHYASWLASGYAGKMSYLSRYAEERRSPSSILPNVRTLLVAVLTESQLMATRLIPPNIEPDSPSGTIVAYAACCDYHTILKKKLHALRSLLAEHYPGEKFRVGVDSEPLLEKEWASRAGLGTIGRNSLLIHPKYGSSIFLGFLLTTLGMEEFESGFAKKEPNTAKNPGAVNPSGDGEHTDPCLGCRRCLDVCPTGAILPDRTLDATKCLNYWTIEYHGVEIPESIREKLGHRLFGCDLCRRLCPKNAYLPPSLPSFIPLDEIRGLNGSQFAERFADTPVERIGPARLKRNACWIS